MIKKINKFPLFSSIFSATQQKHTLFSLNILSFSQKPNSDSSPEKGLPYQNTNNPAAIAASPRPKKRKKGSRISSRLPPFFSVTRVQAIEFCPNTPFYISRFYIFGKHSLFFSFSFSFFFFFILGPFFIFRNFP